MTEKKQQLEDWLDDLCVRFIINLPQDDLSSVPRICFQVEEAQWYYEDFIRPLDPGLPSMTLRNFCLRIFAHCPLLSAFSQENHISAFEDFLQYKTRVPVRGVIMLNEAMDSVVLVKGWKKGASWSFPRGKINMNEDDLDCAIREVYEETGFDLISAGLVPDNRQVKSIEINMREQNLRLYVFRNVPMDTHFEPRTRKEISKVQWWHMADLPAFRKKGQQQSEPTANGQRFYVVAPFLHQLKKWVLEQKTKDNKRVSSSNFLSAGFSNDELLTEEDQGLQTYPQNDGSMITSAPNMMALEDTNAALNRLLKIQPPTEGLQLETNAIQSAVTESNDKGAALLALLRSDIPKATFAPIIPHTPAEQIYSEAPMPKSPYHEHPRHPHYLNLPPPSFPVPNTPTNYSIDGPIVHNYAQSVNTTQPQSDRTPTQQHHHSNPNLHNYQAQHLAHPQPSPPPVQKAIYTGRPVHSPAIPQPIQNQPVHMMNPTSLPIRDPQFPDIHGPMVTSQPKQSPPKLTSHSLALLNAFKSREQATGTASLNDLPLRRYAKDTVLATTSQPQELPAETKRAENERFPSPFGLPHSIATAAAPSAVLSKPSISTLHQSTLLSLFKSSTAGAASPALPPSATALPVSSTPSAVELSAAAPTSSKLTKPKTLPTTSSPRGMSKQDTIMRGLRELTSESKGPLPGIPRASTSFEANMKHDSDRNIKANGYNSVLRNKNTPPQSQPAKPFQPQILKRPQSKISPILGSPTIPSATPPLQATFDRRPAQPAEHVQTLLSLFGKPQAPSDALSTSHLKDAPASMQPSMDASARSRVGSLASGSNETASHRESPISPADKGFLLGYLDAVAKSGTR